MVDVCPRRGEVCPAVCEHRTSCCQCGRLLCSPSANRQVRIEGHFYRDGIVWCMGCYERMFSKAAAGAIREVQ
jgi:hypothetical protein